MISQMKHILFIAILHDLVSTLADIIISNTDQPKYGIKFCKIASEYVSCMDMHK